MKVRGDNAPVALFTLEAQPDRPGWCLVRFYENPEEFTEERDGQTIHGWRYDEYHLELEDNGALEEDISGNLEAYMAQAKAAEGTGDGGDLDGRVSALEAIWNGMAEAYREGVQEA